MAPGVWGRPSATIDWCEDNYAVTKFIAEFWNTLSNAVMIVPPLITIYLLAQQNMEKRFVWCHMGFLCVGIGSWCFHMTLLYSMQLLDELPMIWGTAFLVYAFIEVRTPPRQYNRPLQVVLFLYCLIVTIVYLSTNYPVFHEAAYGVMVVSLVSAAIRTVCVMEQCSKKLFFVALVIYVSGFILWNIDNKFCGSLQGIRDHVGGVFGPLSELHAWWHILAGLGTYLSLLFVTHTRCLVLKQKPIIKYWLKFWPYMSVETKTHT